MNDIGFRFKVRHNSKTAREKENKTLGIVLIISIFIPVKSLPIIKVVLADKIDRYLVVKVGLKHLGVFFIQEMGTSRVVSRSFREGLLDRTDGTWE